MLPSWLSWLGLSAPIVSNEDIERGYAKHPSITDYLPWLDYDDEQQIFLLEDQCSVAACLAIKPVACEARPQEQMQAIQQAIVEALKNSIPLEKDHPWVMQVFVQRDNTLTGTVEKIRQSVQQQEKPQVTQAHLKTLQEHMDYLTRPGGVFYDQMVTNATFHGGRLKIMLCLYRRVKDGKSSEKATHVDQLVRTRQKLMQQLNACGVDARIMAGTEVMRNLTEWFNPNPKQTNGDSQALASQVQCPASDEKPFGWDMTEQLFFKAPQSFEEGWLFDDMPHKVLTIQALSQNPAIGHLTAERQRMIDDKVFVLIDHIPTHSIFVLDITFQALSETEWHLKKIDNSAVGHHALAVKIREQINEAQHAIAHGDYLLPMTMVLYIRGKNLQHLKEVESHAEVLLNSNGFKVITDSEVFPIDAYLRYLPMSYDYAFDRKNSHRSSYYRLSDIASLLPFYSRSTGTEHPGMLMFNRGGEPWLYDLFQDKSKNAHFLLLGETGTGKSNALNFLAMHVLALYNPRLFIIEAGGSFDLFAHYCQSLGLSVNHLKIDLKNPVSLNPFASALQVLNKAKEDNDRDILGDMVLAALVMITGGERKEEERITRSDRLLVMEALILAAQTVQDRNQSQVIASDVIEALQTLAHQLEPDKRRRALEMADGLKYFSQDPVSSRFFNSIGNPWPLADITLVDFGLFAQEGYEAQRSIAFAGCVNSMLALADANQYSQRPIIAIFDENHLFSKLPLLAAIQTRIAKMGRKLGLWLWLATQNLKDFSDESRKMLSLIETWMCFALPPDEIEQIERFKPLTPEQRALFLSAKKVKGQYTEGVVLSSKIQGLFRNVPPRLYLAMAATEQEEKHHRQQLMQQYGYSEIEAVQYIAREMMRSEV